MIIGGAGNMGRRYRCIIENVLKKDVVVLDQTEGKYSDIHECDGVIVTTPTETHLSWLRRLGPTNLPILCEKPLTTRLDRLEAFENESRTYCAQVQMVNQYAYLYDKNTHGDTWYSYWNSGKDGLEFDCLNVIGLSEKRPLYIDNTNPYWHCQINGKKLSIDRMDFAYVSMLRKWVNEPESNWAYAREAHYKVARYMAGRW